MTPIRSMLFVPANKLKWIESIHDSKADAIILDLEDSVPSDDKLVARANVANSIAKLHKLGQRVYVRINRGRCMFDFDDILAVVQPGLEGIMLPKCNGVEDLVIADALIGEAEAKSGLAHGSVVGAPLLETARSIVKAFEIASHPRTAVVVAASAKNGDVARSLGFQWTAEGGESLYLRSSAITAARAAGKFAIGGLWQDVHDLDGLERWARANRGLGFTGELALHPSNVEIINNVFTPSDDEVAYFSGMIEAYELAQKEGRGALVYMGDHIDQAHVTTAREAVAFANDIRKQTL